MIQVCAERHFEMIRIAIGFRDDDGLPWDWRQRHLSARQLHQSSAATYQFIVALCAEMWDGHCPRQMAQSALDALDRIMRDESHDAHQVVVSAPV